VIGILASLVSLVAQSLKGMLLTGVPVVPLNSRSIISNKMTDGAIQMATLYFAHTMKLLLTGLH
jgi:hypothetical protein